METIITPEYGRAQKFSNTPATFTVTKALAVFNQSATKLLSLKKDISFVILVKDGYFYYKEQKNGFIINVMRNDSAKVNGTFLYYGLLKNMPNKDKRFKFLIGEFKDGMWKLNPVIDG